MATMTKTRTNRGDLGLRVGLWVVQGVLAAAFLAAGGMKLTAPVAVLAQNMSFVAHVPAWLVRFIGLSEVLGAFGLILPAATRIMPVLTGWAGIGLATVMALAAVTHVLLGEPGGVAAPLVLGSLAALVAWGRLVKAPIAPRV